MSTADQMTITSAPARRRRKDDASVTRAAGCPDPIASVDYEQGCPASARRNEPGTQTEAPALARPKRVNRKSRVSTEVTDDAAQEAAVAATSGSGGGAPAPETDAAALNGHSTPAVESPKPSSAARQTKRNQIVALLERPEGASLDELIAATGWLPHTTRAALSGLRKSGVMLERSSVDGTSRYRIVR
jgi:hypothetical protein